LGTEPTLVDKDALLSVSPSLRSQVIDCYSSKTIGYSNILFSSGRDQKRL